MYTCVFEENIPMQKIATASDQKYFYFYYSESVQIS